MTLLTQLLHLWYLRTTYARLQQTQIEQQLTNHALDDYKCEFEATE